MGGTQSGKEGTDCPAPPRVGGGRSPQSAMRTDRSSAKCGAARPVPESPPFPRTGRHKATFKMPATHFTSNPNAPAGPLGWEPRRVSGRSAGLSRLPVGGGIWRRSLVPSEFAFPFVGGPCQAESGIYGPRGGPVSPPVIPEGAAGKRALPGVGAAPQWRWPVRLAQQPVDRPGGQRSGL